MAFLGSFLQYAIIMVILAAIALAGFFAGKKLRENKMQKQRRKLIRQQNTRLNNL